MYHKRLICQLSLVLLVAGCAATVQRQDGGAPVPVGTKAPGKHVVLNLTGSDETTSAKDWTGLNFTKRRPSFRCGTGRLSRRVQRAHWSLSMSSTTAMSLSELGSRSE